MRDFSGSIRSGARAAAEHEREQRLVRTVFAAHTSPHRAAQATLSLRSAYPWMSGSLAASLGAYGVPVDHPDIAEIAGASLGRQYRRGWIDRGGRRNTNEVANVRRLEAMNRPGWIGAPDPNAPTRPQDLGIPTGTAQDYAEGSSSVVVPENQWARPAESMTPYMRQQRWPELADTFRGNAATWGSARRILAEQAGETDFYGTASTGAPDPMAGGIGGGVPMSETQDTSRNLVLPGGDEAQARALAGMLPSLDATIRHIRRGGLTFRSIPLPSGDVSADELMPTWQNPETEQILVEERARLEAQYPNLAEAEGAGPVEGVTPSMRAVYDGIVSALDALGASRESIGPNLEVGGFDLNASDLWTGPYGAARTGVRTATMAMDTLWQIGQASFRRIVTDPGAAFEIRPIWTDEGMDAVRTDVGQTDLGVVLDQLAAGINVDTGSGFFVHPNSTVGQTRLGREREQGLIGGHVITMGRWTADTAGLEPDTVPFNILSGAVDLGWMIAEPGGAVVDMASHSTALRRTLAHAGGFTATQSIDAARFAEWLRGSDAERVIDYFSAIDPTDDLAVYRSWQSASQAGRAERMPRWAHDLLARGEVGDRVYVEEMLSNLTGMGYSSPGVPLARAAGSPTGMTGLVAPAVAWRRRVNASRLSQFSPETGARALDVYDADGFANGLESSLRNARVDEETIASLIGRVYDGGFQAPTRVLSQRLEREAADLADSTDPADVARLAEIDSELADLLPGVFVNRPTPRRNVLRDVWLDAQDAKRQRLLAAGVDEGKVEGIVGLSEIGRRVDTLVADDWQSQGLYWLRLTAEGKADNRRLWAMIGGDPTVDASSPGFAHMAAEHLSRYLPLEEDYRQIARLTRSLPHQVLTSWLGTPSSGQIFAPWRWLDESFMSKVWKPSRLLRPAYPIRVVGEEQFRLAAAGLDGAFNHPLSALAMTLGARRDGRFHRALDAVAGDKIGEAGAHATDTLGTPWEAVTEFQQSLNRGMGNWVTGLGGGANGRFTPRAYVKAADGSLTPGYEMAWADLMARAHSDDITRRVAQILLGEDSQFDTIDDLIEAGGRAVTSADELRLAGPDEAGAWIRNTRADLMDSHPVLGQRGERTYAARFAAEDADELAHNWDDYVESVQVRLFEMTGRDPELMHLVARGQFSDGMSLRTGSATRVNKRAASRLADDFAEIAPPAIAGDVSFHDQALGRVNKAKGYEGYDRALETMFNLLAATPTDRLSRSPAFRQFYVRRMRDLLPNMTPSAQERFIASADELMQLPQRGFHLRVSAYIDEADSTVPTVSSLRRMAGGSSGDMTLEMADELAKGAALDNTRWLLYDVHKRGLFMDAMRVVFPFGEAWKEVATRWLQLTANRPGTVIQRSTQLVQATGSPQDWESIVDDPSQHGQVFTNATGETVFAYPGAEWFTAAMTGVPVEFTGALNGLTIMNSVLPGLGPAVQVPLSMVPAIRDSPQMEGLRNVLFPFGMGDPVQDNPGGFVTDLLFSPAVQRVFQGIAAGGLNAVEIPGTDIAPVGDVPGVRNVIQGFASIFGGGAVQQDRMFLNSVFDVMRYRVSAGEGSTGTQAEIQRLIEDSTQDAGLLYIIRGLAGMTLPSAPIPEFQVQGSDGSMLMLRGLVEQYRNMQNENWATASQRFMEMYGENMALVMQAKTVSTSAMLPTTQEADNWVQANPSVTTDYPVTFGLWAPGNTDDNDFDFDAYTRYARNRQREVLGRELDLTDLVYLSNDHIASTIYRQVEEGLLAQEGATTESGNLTAENQAYLSTVVRTDLEANYPGFGTDGLHRGPSTDDLRDILDPGNPNAEVRRMVDDERVDAELRDAVRTYLEVHDEAINVWSPEADSQSYYESIGTAWIREYMRYTVYPGIREDLPREFRSRWDVIFERLFDRVMLDPGDEPTADMEVAA